MDTNTRSVRFDNELQIEAYQFTEIVQPFPNHFHDYYVIGLIETGQRCVTVNHQEYNIVANDMLTLNPMDSHSCEHIGTTGLTYRGLNIKQSVMLRAARDISGFNELPHFCSPILYQTLLADTFRALHESIMHNEFGMAKEELFLLFMQQLLTDHSEIAGKKTAQTVRIEIETVCNYLHEHYAERVTLDMLGNIAGLNKYTLLRLFTRHKGITPYRYLETVRINKARALLEQGTEPADVALRIGFFDQSHFTSYFSKLIGLTPGQYQTIFLESSE